MNKLGGRAAKQQKTKDKDFHSREEVLGSRKKQRQETPAPEPKHLDVPPDDDFLIH